MAIFDEREQGFERKYQHDQELGFKVKARRNHLLGRWAAEKLGLAGAAAEAYASEVAAAALQADQAVIAKIAADFAGRHVALDKTHIELELERCAAAARKALGAGN
jgi:hypothetical protein